MKKEDYCEIIDSYLKVSVRNLKPNHWLTFMHGNDGNEASKLIQKHIQNKNVFTKS